MINSIALKNFFQSSICQAVCLNLFFLMLCLGIGGIHFGSLDDYFMSAVITGAYGGGFDPHTLFVNGAYAYLLKPLYAFFPKVSWYFILELLSVFISFTVFVYFLIKRVPGRLGLALSCIILACLAPDSYLQLAFTQCAAVSTTAGILLFYFGSVEKRWKPLFAAAVFIFVGIMFRREGSLLGLPFLCAIFLFSLIEKRHFYKPVVGFFVVIIIAYFALLSFNNSLFQEEDYSNYRESQWCRSTFGDGGNYDDDAVYDELEERQMQGRDFWFMSSWIFYDTKVFSLDSLKSFVQVVNRNRYQSNYIRMPGALFVVFANSFFKANAWCWAIICFLFFYFSTKRAIWYTWISLGLICLCLSYLLLLNRVVYHVESGIWLYAIVCAVPFMRGADYDKKAGVRYLPVLLFAFAAGLLVMALSNQGGIKNNRIFFGVPEMPKDWKSFESYMNEHKDDVFLLYSNEYKYLANYRDPPYKAVAPHSWGNIIPIGYWNVNLPGMKRELAERGVQNPIGELTKNNVFVLETDTLHRFNRFYEVHYHESVAIDTIKVFGELRLVKYRREGGGL